ncbi:MAG: 2-amino-4-hydroxy-6-hydroxymethyldihydropteridine diphosphokinase [Phycisphaerales bacterium]|jgi:2-amino-4-hydroxy-6-hydroxymethyldihydropteridine diphosphokinase|nr:2-amino-4-hydroxy-6-hydroxymethyldihydropteridine diphosphokinase [Phycisphaerales bacterium]
MMQDNVFLGLGSNLDNRKSYLENAVSQLDSNESINVLKRSSIIQTEPLGDLAQPMFLNRVIEIETSLSPSALLDVCLEIELSNDRVRGKKWAPRTLDVDILFYGNEIVDSDALKIPHPRAHQRRFVLEPMAEISPLFEHPIIKKTIFAMLQLL